MSSSLKKNKIIKKFVLLFSFFAPLPKALFALASFFILALAGVLSLYNSIMTRCFFSRLCTDTPQVWQLKSQDAAAPITQRIFDLHQDIFFCATLILIFVLWMLLRSFSHSYYGKDLNRALASLFFFHPYVWYTNRNSFQKNVLSFGLCIFACFFWLYVFSEPLHCEAPIKIEVEGSPPIESSAQSSEVPNLTQEARDTFMKKVNKISLIDWFFYWLIQPLRASGLIMPKTQKSEIVNDAITFGLYSLVIIAIGVGFILKHKKGKDPRDQTQVFFSILGYVFLLIGSLQLIYCSFILVYFIEDFQK